MTNQEKTTEGDPVVSVPRLAMIQLKPEIYRIREREANLAQRRGDAKIFKIKNMKKKDDGKTSDISTPLLCLAAFPSQPSDQARTAFGLTISSRQSLISPLCAFASLREFPLLSGLLLQNRVKPLNNQ